MMDKLLLLLRWVKAYREIALLYAEEHTVFICRRNCFHQCHFWKLVDINPRDCYAWFGVSNSNLERLFKHWRVPDTLSSATPRHVYGGEECFIIILYHMIKGVLFTEMARHTFGGDPWHFSTMNMIIINHLYLMFYHKISGRRLDQCIHTGLHTCRRLIYDALSDGAIEEVEYENGEVVDTR
jgi:hypothetical protein